MANRPKTLEVCVLNYKHGRLLINEVTYLFLFCERWGVLSKFPKNGGECLYRGRKIEKSFVVGVAPSVLVDALE